MMIDRCNWTINKEVLAYWESIGKTVLCYGETWEQMGQPYSAVTYFYVEDHPPVSVGSADKNVIANKNTDNKWRFQFGNNWYPEDEIVKIIKLKAFL